MRIGCLERRGGGPVGWRNRSRSMGTRGKWREISEQERRTASWTRLEKEDRGKMEKEKEIGCWIVGIV